MGELSPDAAKIVLGATEMTTDELPDVLSNLFREQQHREQRNSDEDEEGLELERACPAIMLNNLCEHANDEQVATYEQHRDGGVENSPRRININLAEAAPEVTNTQERTTNQHSDGLNFAQGVVVTRKNQCLTAGVNSCPKNHRQPENQKLDSPLHCSDSGAKGTLEIHQHQNGAHQDCDIDDFASGKEADPKLRRIRARPNFDKVAAKSE